VVFPLDLAALLARLLAVGPPAIVTEID